MQKQQQVVIRKVKDLIPDSNQPRKEFDEKVLQSIGGSYQEHGMINPIEIDENDMIVTGETRWRACVAVGVEEIPTIFISGLDPITRKFRQCAENMARNSMTTKEQVEAWQELFESKEFRALVDTHVQQNPKVRVSEDDTSMLGVNLMARKMGISTSWSKSLFRFAYKTQRPIVDMVYRGDLAATAVPEIEKVNNKDLELPIAQKVSDDEMTVHSTRDMVEAINDNPGREQDILDRTFSKKHSTMIKELGELLAIPPEPRTGIDDSIDEAQVLSKIAGLIASLKRKGKNVPTEKRVVMRDLVTELIQELTKFRDEIIIDGELVEDEPKLLN